MTWWSSSRLRDEVRVWCNEGIMNRKTCPAYVPAGLLVEAGLPLGAAV
ncbi:MAG: hypothetical protein V8R10_13310 [Christensenellales bacterium]